MKLKKLEIGGIKLNAVVIPNIRKIINERGLKQCAVAEKAGYSKQQFNAMLTGRKLITVDDVMIITNVLGVDANTLFDRETAGAEGR